MPWGRGSWLWRQEAPGSILASVGAGGGVSRCNHNRWAFVDISQDHKCPFVFVSFDPAIPPVQRDFCAGRFAAGYFQWQATGDSSMPISSGQVIPYNRLLKRMSSYMRLLLQNDLQ